MSDIGRPVERSLLISLLKLTEEGPVQRGLVGRAARVPSEVADGVRRRFRFKEADRTWEVDVLGLREPLIVSVDCKHWIRGWRRSALTRAVGSQVERTRALARALPSLRERLELSGWDQARLVPVVLALAPGPLKFHDGVPIVPILQLQDFLNELPAHLTELTQISTRL